VLIRLALNIIAPEVDDLVPQPIFSLLDVVDEGAELSTAPTTGGYGAPAG
jgi:hypothetical protein